MSWWDQKTRSFWQLQCASIDFFFVIINYIDGKLGQKTKRSEGYQYSIIFGTNDRHDPLFSDCIFYCGWPQCTTLSLDRRARAARPHLSSFPFLPPSPFHSTHTKLRPVHSLSAHEAMLMHSRARRTHGHGPDLTKAARICSRTFSTIIDDATTK